MEDTFEEGNVQVVMAGRAIHYFNQEHNYSAEPPQTS